MIQLLNNSIDLNDIVISIEYRNQNHKIANLKNIQYVIVQKPYKIRILHLIILILMIAFTVKITKQTINQENIILNSILDKLESYEHDLKRIVNKQKLIEANINLKKPFDLVKNVNNQAIVDELKKYVDKSIQTYNADKTGMADFASESIGGSIMFTKCTKNYEGNSRWFTIFGFPIFRLTVSPRVIIQNSVQPGKCWAFSGQARVFIKLAANIIPKMFSIEHIPKVLSLSGRIDSAPNNFTVFGYENKEELNEENHILLGNFQYNIHSEKNLQFFDVQNLPRKPISVIELFVNSNSGNKDYTCLYKFRVHGHFG